MKYAVVTTFHDNGYHQYAKRMIETFVKNWPQEVKLYLYPENVNPAIPQGANIELVDLTTGVPDLARFKSTWKNVPKANGDISGIPKLSSRNDNHKSFKWDAVRFAHKVYAIFHCAKNTDADVLIWMDADMVCHSAITMDTIVRLIPADTDLCFLGRNGKFSECGLYSMNLKSPAVQTFLAEFQRMYDDAESGIFLLDEWHDSFVFDAVRNRFPYLNQLSWSQRLGDLRPSPTSTLGEGHPLINSEWGAYLDHLKGERKKYGRSHAKDLKVTRNESYWK
jgi:hypothetical protein